jgi:hypothetical protein
MAPERRLAAILYTDIVGSTAVTARSEPAGLAFRTAVSCGSTSGPCSLGSGPTWSSVFGMTLAEDGLLYVSCHVDGTDDVSVVAVDPATGDRTLISSDNLGGGYTPTLAGPLVVWPGPDFFMVQVLPPWALVLAPGVLLGLTLRVGWSRARRRLRDA